MTITTKLVAVAGSALAAAALTPTSALAQQRPPDPLGPLGGGRVLDANLSPIQGRLNTKVFDLQAMIRYNNAIVTGGATGGRSLRVPTGYTSDYGPFGGSSSVYRFNRDASDPRLSMLGAASPNSTGRTGLLAPLGTTAGSAPITTRIDAREPQASPLGLSRSQAAATTRVGALARSRASGNSGLIVGLDRDARGGLGAVRASTLRGLTVDALPDSFISQTPQSGSGPSRPDQPVSPSARPIDTRITTRIDPVTGQLATSPASSPAVSAADNRPLADLTDPRSGPSSLQPLRAARSIEPMSRPGAGSAQIQQARSGFRSALVGATRAQQAREEAARRASAAATSSSPSTNPGTNPSTSPRAASELTPLTPEEVEATLERMRARLRGDYVPLLDRAGSAINPASTLRCAPAPAVPVLGQAGIVTPSVTLNPRERLEELPEGSAVDALREMNVRLKQLVPPGATTDQSADGYLRFGQELLANGRFASAEQAFEQALLLRPGDPMARVGVAHAAIGSGMLLSGSLELKNVLIDHPELIGVRFDHELLMPRARAAQIVEDVVRLRELSPSSDVAKGGALIQAYLGRQFDEPQWQAQGLEAMATTWTAGPEPQLRALLQGAWTPQPQP
jgi:hypothetical protein